MMDQNQNQLTIRTYMAIMAERDAAVQERNMCLEERKRALAERDMAMLQRDAALAERNFAIQERDEAIAALRSLESSLTQTTVAPDATNSRKYDHTELETDQFMAEAAYPPRENLIGDLESFRFAEIASESDKPKKARQLKESKQNRYTKVPRVAEKAGEELRTPLSSANLCSHPQHKGHGIDEYEQDIQLDMLTDHLRPIITFDESVMPTPVCTCTGSPQPCYRWGNGGWQSACCTTAISMYPLPQVSNKRYTRVGGRKMSGNAFTKLLNRLASEGHDLSAPLDLKDHWAKHGTNRYTTVK